MKPKLSFVTLLLLVVLINTAFAQTDPQSTTAPLMVDQSAITMIDNGAANITTGNARYFTINAEGNLAKTKVESITNKTIIKRADFDTITLERKKQMIIDRELYLIVE